MCGTSSLLDRMKVVPLVIGFEDPLLDLTYVVDR